MPLTPDDSFQPTRVMGSLVCACVDLVTCGAFHSLVLTHDHILYAFGDNRSGQLGLGSSHSGTCLSSPMTGTLNVLSEVTMSSSPIEVAQLSGEMVVDVAAGAFHSLALTQHGHIFTWVRHKYISSLANSLLGDRAYRISGASGA